MIKQTPNRVCNLYFSSCSTTITQSVIPNSQSEDIKPHLNKNIGMTIMFLTIEMSPDHLTSSEQLHTGTAHKIINFIFLRSVLVVVDLVHQYQHVMIIRSFWQQSTREYRPKK
jgi:hypothetical protein